MRLLLHSLQDYPPAMLRAIAEVNGLSLTSNATRSMIEQIAGLLGDPARLPIVVASCSSGARAALDELLRGGGRSQRLAFERQHGAIRAIGPGRLQRERPHLTLANPTEELWYRGVVFSAFAETPAGLVEFLYVPDDLVVLLPAPDPASAGWHVPACLPPAAIRTSHDLLLHDMCTLLCLVQTGEIALVDRDDATSWLRTSLYELRRFALQPVSGQGQDEDAPGGPASLALTLAGELGWLRPGGRRKAALHAGAVRTWLEAPRRAQRQDLRDAWLASPAWNDLCRTPSLACEDTGNWHNDPVATRRRLLPLFAHLESGSWYEPHALVAAVKGSAPDFQRPDAVYDTWYIRERTSQTYLRGFDSWDAVEGALLRFLITGPLHWLGVFDLAQPDGAETPGAKPLDGPAVALDGRFSPTASGRAWLAEASLPDEETGAGALTVLGDYTILVPGDAPLHDRFRVSRFTTWEPAGPSRGDAMPLFRYRITQSGLRRAAAQGIEAGRVLAFLQERSLQPLPASVVSGLERWERAARRE